MRLKKSWTLEQIHANCNEDDGCLIWKGAYHHQSQIPQIQHGGKRYSARRLVMQLAGKRVRPTGFVTAVCGTHGCLNPKHLKCLPVKKHMAMIAVDAKQKEFFRRKKISDTIRKTAKLANHIDYIRSSSEPCWKVAQELGVNKSSIAAVRSHRIYKTHSSVFSGLL